VDRSGKLIWDNVGKALLFDEGVNTGARLRAGQALLQQANEDYVAR
jgi:predicted phosphoribosyltransferase